MKMLSDSNLVKVEKDGKWNHYSLNWAVVDELTAFLNKNSPISSDKSREKCEK